MASAPLSVEPPSRFRHSPPLECLSLRLASSGIVAAARALPLVGVSRASLSSAALRPAVTPTTPVGVNGISSVELPLGSVRAEPTVTRRLRRPFPVLRP